VTRLVADASAVVDVLAGAPTSPQIRRELSAVSELDVPEHFHIEAISALRGLLGRGDISSERADRALDLLVALRVVRHPVAPFAREIWALRDTLTAYDAAYLTLAQAIEARVLTTDRGLAAAARDDGRLIEL